MDAFGKILKVQLPFILSDKPFIELGSPTYSWDTNEEMTLLVHSEQARNGTTAYAATAEASNIQIEGCPLECPFDPNEDFDAAINTYIPLGIFKGIDYNGLPLNEVAYSFQEARKLRVQMHKKFKEADPDFQKLATQPIYIATNKRGIHPPMSNDGRSDASFCLIGCSQNYEMCNLLVVGPQRDVAEHFDMKGAIEAHGRFQRLRASDIITRDVHAIYEKIHGEFESEGNVYLEFVWSGPEQVFDPPPPNSQVKVAVKPRQGDASPSLRKLWEEVDLLDRLMEIYNTYSRADFHNSTYRNATELSHLPDFSEELKLLLTQQNTPKLKKESDFSESLENNLDHAVKGERNDSDFTDRLWSLIVAKGGGVPLIHECLHAIYCEVESKNYRPHVFPGNETLFNNLVKQLVSGKVVNFRAVYTPKFVLQLAIDCGITKLFKDYSFVLRMCHLLETPDLKAFRPKYKALEESLTNVKKLHCLLEVLSLTNTRLSLSMNLEELYARKMAQYLLKNKLDWDRAYHFDISFAALETVMKGLLPVYWNLRLENDDGINIIRTNIIYSRDMHIGHVSYIFTYDGVLQSGFYIYLHTLKVKKTTPTQGRARM